MTTDFGQATLEGVHRVHGGRLLGDGVPPADVQASRMLADWTQWLPFWRKRAERYESMAAECSARGLQRSTGAFLWYASICLHYGQFLWVHDAESKEQAQRRKVELYDDAAPLLWPPAETATAVVDGIELRAFVRTPPFPGPHPCVILLGGLESTKEEGLRFEELCLERGIATCAFDGPGQGECYFQSPMRADFERFTSGVVDTIVTREDINDERLGVLGRSLGGYYAVRSAAADPRFRVCVAWGAMYDLSFFKRLHSLTQQAFAYVSGGGAPDEAMDRLTGMINLDDIIAELRAPLYVQHGGRDDLIPTDQVERLKHGAVNAERVVVELPEEGNHCCHNIFHIARPQLADWLVEELCP